MSATCSHLGTIDETLPRDRGAGCVECLKIGTRWVHLRQCMQCGAVLCCDDSPMRHATAHNAGAALLLLATIALNRSLRPARPA